jgi:hypothetical protein
MLLCTFCLYMRHQRGLEVVVTGEVWKRKLIERSVVLLNIELLGSNFCGESELMSLKTSCTFPTKRKSKWNKFLQSYVETDVFPASIWRVLDCTV